MKVAQHPADRLQDQLHILRLEYEVAIKGLTDIKDVRTFPLIVATFERLERRKLSLYEEGVAIGIAPSVLDEARQLSGRVLEMLRSKAHEVEGLLASTHG